MCSRPVYNFLVSFYSPHFEATLEARHNSNTRPFYHNTACPCLQPLLPDGKPSFLTFVFCVL